MRKTVNLGKGTKRERALEVPPTPLEIRGVREVSPLPRRRVVMEVEKKEERREKGVVRGRVRSKAKVNSKGARAPREVSSKGNRPLTPQMP